MKTYLIAAAAAAAMALSATQAGAGILAAGNNSLGGTTSALEPQLAGTVVQDIDTAVSFAAGGGTFNANVQSRVVLADDGTYDFSWRIHDTSFDGVTVAPAALGAFRLGAFGESIVGLNGNYRTDGVGAVGPDIARVFTGALDGYVNFIFNQGLAAGTDSYFMFLDTSATHYAKTAIFDLTSAESISGQFATFGVAGVPEPATWALMIGGFGLAGASLRRRRAMAA